MLNKIFDQEELPNFKIYEMAQTVVNDYMVKNNCKIDVVAQKLNTTVGVLYRQLNPRDMQMPLSVDRVIALTKLTQDNRILETIANEFDCVVIPKICSSSKIADVNLLVDVANMENSDVFRTVKTAMADGVITEDEKSLILKEINEAQKANAELKDKVLHLAIKGE